MIERFVRYILKLMIICLSLFGLRYVLALISIILPIEWFGVFLADTLGFNGILLLLIIALLVNFF